MTVSLLMKRARKWPSGSIGVGAGGTWSAVNKGTGARWRREFSSYRGENDAALPSTTTYVCISICLCDYLSGRSISAAPLIMGNDLRTVPADHKAILLNTEAIAIDQVRLTHARHGDRCSETWAPIDHRVLSFHSMKHRQPIS